MIKIDSCRNSAHLPCLTENQIRDIHQASIQILSETGMWIGNKDLVEMACARGLAVDGQMVYFTEEVVEKAIAAASCEFLLKARNSEYDMEFNLDTTAVGMGRSAPFVMTRDGQRRTADADDFIALMKLGHSLDAVQLPGPLVFPGEIPEKDVYAFMMAAQVRYSDKPFHLTTDQDLDILCMSMGITPETLKKDAEKGICYGQVTVNSLSPLAFTDGQGRILKNMAEHGIPLCLSPTPATGATGPCSIFGNLVLNNCEILGMLVFAQWVRPGLPVFYGAFPSGSDMRTMNATYGGPETRKMEMASGLMAKHYGLLSRSNVVNDAQVSDFQAGAESMFNLVTAFEGQVNFIPGCGLLASFAAASSVKMVLDAELIEYARYYSRPISCEDTVEQTVAFIQEVGPRGNFVTNSHTYSNFRDVLHHPDLFSRVSYEKWANGRACLVDDAQNKADKLLQDYQQPDIDTDLDKRLAVFCEPG